MYVIAKTFTDNNGKPRAKLLTGRDSICCEFTLVPYATNVKEWKTREGAQRWLDDRPDFVRLHQQDGSVVAIK